MHVSQPPPASHAHAPAHAPAHAVASAGSLCRPPVAASKSDFESWWKSGVLVWKLKGSFAAELSEAAFLSAVGGSGTLCVFAHSSGSATGTFKAYVFARGSGAFDGQAAVAEVSIVAAKKSVGLSCRATHGGLQSDFTSTLQVIRRHSPRSQSLFVGAPHVLCRRCWLVWACSCRHKPALKNNALHIRCECFSIILIVIMEAHAARVVAQASHAEPSNKRYRLHATAVSQPLPPLPLPQLLTYLAFPFI